MCYAANILYTILLLVSCYRQSYLLLLLCSTRYKSISDLVVYRLVLAKNADRSKRRFAVMVVDCNGTDVMNMISDNVFVMIF
jgi:hypothetical protein